VTPGAHSDVRFNIQGAKTREEILRAAGKLFSQNGYGLTSVRDLARESGAGLSTIIYHFKSKENLYIETVRHFALEMVRINSHFEPLFTVDTDDPQAVADALLSSIYSFLNACHGPDRVENLIGLYNRLIVEGHAEAVAMLIECFADIQRRLPEFFRRVRPELSDISVRCMQQLFWSQLQYTVVSKQLVIHDQKLPGDFTEQFLKDISWHIAHFCCLPLKLPEPRWSDSVVAD
jgi:TetR/AcrR family transcriptional regulator, regulator of cefoperazone and chloramphenicol sensitivity